MSVSADPEGRTVRAVELSDGFGLDNLHLAGRRAPVPGWGEVAVRIAAVSLNYRDHLLVAGVYNPRQRLPVVPCSDAAGVVESVGPGVTRWQPGDRVVSLFMPNWSGGPPDAAALAGTRGGPHGDGVLAEAALFREDALLPVPEGLELAEAATLPCAGVTAWSAVIKHGAARPGTTVVVQGTGGVALFAAQFARAAGARVALMSSSDEKLAKLADIGADVTLNYRTTPEWGKAVRAAFGVEGVDLVIEIGGAETLEQSLRAVRAGGTIALIGVVSGPAPRLDLPLAVMREVRLQGVTVGSRQDALAMHAGVASHAIRPVISHRVPLEDCREAFALMAAGGHIGKIVIDVGG